MTDDISTTAEGEDIFQRIRLLTFALGFGLFQQLFNYLFAFFLFYSYLFIFFYFTLIYVFTINLYCREAHLPYDPTLLTLLLLYVALGGLTLFTLLLLYVALGGFNPLEPFLPFLPFDTI